MLLKILSIVDNGFYHLKICNQLQLVMLPDSDYPIHDSDDRIETAKTVK